MTPTAVPSGETFRCFVALPVSNEVRGLFASFAARAESRFPGYRFGDAANLHITLQFLGDVPRSMSQTLTEAIARSADGVEPFRAGCCEAGAFPKRGVPRILHVTVTEGNETLISLAARTRRDLGALGLLDSKPFTPHITLGRERKTTGSGSIGRLTGDGSNIRSLWKDSYRQFLEEGRRKVAWEINEVLLMESFLNRQGPVYTPVGRVQLAPPNTRTHSLWAR